MLRCKPNCPTDCKCEAGATWDGGKAPNNQGYCEHYCSKWGYCGNGTKYSNGTDCTGCKIHGMDHSNHF